MIDSIKCIKNLGPFKAIHDVKLAQTTLIFAENGRGKTMLSEAFRSQATDEPDLVAGRKRLGADGVPVIVLEQSGGAQVLHWKPSGWQGGRTKMAVFNDGFVDANVYSGLEVTSEHRKRLHSVVVGEEGVQLARKYHDEVQRSKDALTEIGRLATELRRHVDAEVNVKEFCGWEPEEDIDQQISRNDNRLDAARNESSISRLNPLSGYATPQVELGSIQTLLHRTASHLNQEAANRVQDHLNRLWDDAESWVREGVDHTDKRSCPYCGQDLSASEIVADYEHYFNEAYSALKGQVEETRVRFQSVSNEGRRNDLTNRHDANDELLRKWNDYGLETGKREKLDLVALKQDWIDFELQVNEALTRKASTPLQEVRLAQGTDELWSRCGSRFDAANNRIKDLNQEIEIIKAMSKSEDIAALMAEELRLNRLKKRSEPRIMELCEQYVEAKKQRDRAENAKDLAKASLDEYEESAFTRYRDSVNSRLKGFVGTRFNLDDIQGDRPGGVVTTSFVIGIGEHRVPVKSARAPASKLSFSNTLSAGDRRSLALSYFMASLENQGDLSESVVVFDDPSSSLDGGRRDKTIESIVLLAPKVQQLIVMSHDPRFLCELNDGLKRQGQLIRLTINRHREESRIASWDIDDACMGDAERHASCLEEYATTGKGEVREVVKHIRPLLEAYLQLAFRQHFDSNAMLGEFTHLCESRLLDGDPLLDRGGLDMLESLNDFSKKHMHHNPPPLTHDELVVRVDEALRFCRGERDGPTS